MANSRSIRIRSFQIFLVLLVFAGPLFLSSPASPGTVAFDYDETGRLLSETYSNGVTIHYTYDEAGNRLSREILNTQDTLTLLSPNGGEEWQPGTSETIYWTGKGGANVKIELFKGSALSKTISPSTPTGADGEGSLEWTIPTNQPAGFDYKVKVTNLQNSAISDKSRGSFTIERKPSLASTAPKAGAIWAAGTTHTVTWTFTGDPGSSVRIELLKGGALYGVLSDNAPLGNNGTGSFSWPVPEAQTPGADYAVKLTAPATGKTSTSATFTILGGIVVTYPNSGSTFQGGTDQVIDWTYTGSPGDSVKIELIKGSSVQSIIAPSAPGGNDGHGSFAWPVPVALPKGSDYRIRITSTSNASYQGTSADPFTIEPASLTVDSPNGGDELQAGETSTIIWDHKGNPGAFVKIELLKAGAIQKVITPSVPTTDRSCQWSVPVGQPGGADYKIRVTSTKYGAFTDASDNPFTIHPTSIQVTAPNSWETWQRGTEQTISWSYAGKPGSAVKIELLKGGAVQSTLASSWSMGEWGQGGFPWQIPSGLATGYDYTIRVSSTTAGAYQDVSDTTFSITDSLLRLDAPNGGDELQAGSARDILWTYTGSPGGFLKIELLKGNAVQKVLAASVPMGSDGWGSWSWAIPGAQPPGSDYRVRITSTTKSGYTDTSDYPFTILPPLVVSAPDGGGQFEAGGSLDISWFYAGNPGSKVKIELLDDEAVQKVIASGAPVGSEGRGSLTWPIPVGQAGGSNYRVRVTSTTNSLYSDANDTPFTILPSAVTVISPNGGEELQAGTKQTIEWAYSGKPGASVKIELLKAGAVQSLIASQASMGSDGRGSYDWSVPGGLGGGSDYAVRLTSTTNGGYTDTSDAPFTVKPSSITLLSPDGGSYNAGGTCDVSWSFYGVPGATVTLNLLKGEAWQYTIASGVAIGTAGNGLYHWKIPVGIAGGDDYSIRITSNKNYSGVSPSPFTIDATGLTLISPVGGEQWPRGTAQRIIWNFSGSPGKTVKIELRKGAAVVRTLASAAPIWDGNNRTFEFEWTVPSTLVLGNDYRIKITASGDSAYSDISEQAFAIVK